MVTGKPSPQRPTPSPPDEKGFLMAWWEKLEPSYKALTVILAAIGLGMAFMAWLIGQDVGANAQDIRQNAEAMMENRTTIRAMQASQDTIKADLGLVRCWARHEIQGLDPRECLFSHDNGTGGR